MKFVHLHVHSHYSLLDGLSKIDELVSKASQDEMPALALTDHGVMYGAIEFYQKCKKAGIKPIIGCEMYLVKDHLDKSKMQERFHLVLLAKDKTGYDNLIKLTTIAHLHGFYYKPRIDWQVLEKYKEGLVASTACLQGEIPKAITRNKSENEIIEIIQRYKNLFGEDFYLEVQYNPSILEQKIVNEKIFELSAQHNVEVIASNDSHYLNTEDAEAHDILLCLQTKKKRDDTDRMSMLGEDFSLLTAEQMINNFREHPEAIENTIKVAEKCNLELDLGQNLLPNFEIPGSKEPFEYLKELTYAGVPTRYDFDSKIENPNEEQKIILNRIAYELGVIEKTGYSSYFLIVQDFINWAKNNRIVVGPGRGSAAGSIVSYLVNITNIDPIKYGLLFERFLNPERISMPDVDIDFADIRRDKVIKYVEEKYGHDHVAQIITFGTMASRAAVRDVGRVLDFPYEFCDKISKLIPTGMSLQQATEKIVELKTLYAEDNQVKRLIDLARRLEGVCRHASKHACGVVITPRPLDELVPCQYASGDKDSIVTQYSLHPVEALGLLKMDFLGLKNLTIIEHATKIIYAVHKENINIDDIPLDDEKTYKLFQKGMTTGVFQFESGGIRSYLRQLKPTNFEDLIAMVALYRPGPMELIPDYIARKHGKKKVEYLHPKLEPSLKKTFGIAIYQEQLMKISRDLAGFTLGEADILRKAVGKKIAELLAEQKEKFIQGCIDNGVEKNKAQAVFSFIEPFAGYGFNRSHAACYALIAYQTAYLKANYPAEFMAALLTADMDNMDRIALEIEECKRMGIKILAPDINESFSNFGVIAETLKTSQPQIRFGLNAIRNVGENVVHQITEQRKDPGPYEDLEDFLNRVQSKDLNKKSLEGLVKSGAFDKFNNRNTLLSNVDKILAYLKMVDKRRNQSQTSLFVSDSKYEPLHLEQMDEQGAWQLLDWEREFLGLYISAHPFDNVDQSLLEYFVPIQHVRANFSRIKKDVRIGGAVSFTKKIITKKGDPMLFARLEDLSGNVEVIIFPNMYKEKSELFEEGALVAIEGQITDKDDDPRVIVNAAWKVPHGNAGTLKLDFQERDKSKGVSSFGGGGATSAGAGDLVINYPRGASKEIAEQVKAVFLENPGEQLVFLRVGEKTVRTNFRVGSSYRLKVQLTDVLGDSAFK